MALMREIKSQAPQIECEINAWNIPRLLIINLRISIAGIPNLFTITGDRAY